MIKRFLLFHGVTFGLLALASDVTAQTSPLSITRMVPSNGVLHLVWAGGPAGPYVVQQRPGLQAAWVDVGAETLGHSAVVPLSGPGPSFFRIKALTSDLTAPTLPGNLTVTASDCATVILNWSASSDTGGSGLKGYHVFRGGVFLKFVAAPATSTTDSGLAGATAYTYAVAAVDNADNSSAAASSSPTAIPACNLPPVANAGPDRSAVTGSNVSFNGSSSTDPDGAIVSYAWNFGDGGTAAGMAALHSFASAGTYQVTLTVTDNAGASSTDTAAITVTNAPVVVPSTGEVILAGGLPAISVAQDVQVQGPLAFVACNALGLSVVDLTTPSAPQLLGSADLPFDGANLVLHGSFAIVTGQRKYHASAGARVTVNGLYVINVASPTNPVVVGRLESSAMYFYGLAVAGSYAYVACGLDGVQVVDLSNPAQPAVVGPGCPLPGWAWSTVASGSHLFVADGTEGLRILSLAHPVAPVEVGFADTPGNAVSLGLLGSMVYVADGATVQIIDAGNRAAPALRGSYALGGANNNAVRVVARTEGPKAVAYVAAGGGGLVTVDVTTPSASVKLGSIAPSGGPNAQTRSVALIGSTALLANYDGGLTAIGVGNPATPTLVSKFTQWFAAAHVAVSGPLAVATGVRYWEGGRSSTNGLQVISKQNPTNPVVLGMLESSSTQFNGLALAGTYAYVACGLDGVKVVDLSNPSRPAFVGPGCALPGWAWSVTLSGNHLYVADGTEGLRVLNIANPVAPVEVGFVDTPGNALSVSVWGTTAYVADGNSVQFINLATPAQPAILGGYAMGGGANTAMRVVARTEGPKTVAYIASGGGGLTVVDATVPAVPVKLGSLLPTGGPNAQTRSVSLSGSLAYVANADGGVGVIDISAPGAMRLLKSVLTPGVAQTAVLDGGWLFAGDSLTTLNSVRLFP